MNALGVTLDDKTSPIRLEDLEKVAGQVDETDLELLPFFEEEAGAEIKKIESILHAWHANSVGSPLDDLRLQFHTLKGAANCVGQLRIGSLAGGMKDVLDSITTAEAFALRSELTKTSIMVLELIRVLLKEAHSPQYNPAKKEQILKGVHALLDLRKKTDALKPRP